MRYRNADNVQACVPSMTGRCWQLPDAPLRTSLVVTAAAGCLGAAGAGVAAGAWIGAGALYPLSVTVMYLAIILLVAGLIGAHHPFTRLGPANQLTLLRATLVALIAGLAGQPGTAQAAWLAVAVTVLVGTLDGVDGLVARRTGMASDFGARFDMETDAALILVLSLLVWQHEKAGAWVLACGVMRYGFVAAGWMLPWMAAPRESTRRGKTVAAAQFVGLGVALAPVIPVPFSAVSAGVVLAALCWSFAADVQRLWRRRVSTAVR